MSTPVVPPSVAVPLGRLPAWPSERVLISDQEWQALLCHADELQQLESSHLDDQWDVAFDQGSLS